MKLPVVLLTANETHAGNILKALADLRVLLCRKVEEVRLLCQSQNLALVLIVDDPPDIDGHKIFVELSSVQPGLAGILLVPGRPDAHVLQGALDAGFSGLVELRYAPELLAGVVQQAWQRYKLQWENSRLRTLVPLYRLGELFFAATTEQDLLEELLQAVTGQTGAHQISVMLYDAEEKSLRIVASRGLDPALAASIRVAPGEQISGWVYQQGKSVILNKEDQHSSMFATLLKQPDLVTAISFPLRICDRVIGVLNISQKTTEERFSSADKEMLSIICSQAANALDNLRSRQLLAQTTRLRTLFEQYVAPEVAELLLAQHTDLMDLGEITQVTVLFADIRNFTRLVQHVELPLLRRFLNEFFQMFTDVVFQWQGTVDKFMGDAVLSVFGAPVKLENPSLAAVQAAWAIRSRFADLRQRWIPKSQEFAKVDLGVAVTSGTMFIGNIGSCRRFDYTVIGNEVNFAQRLAAESSECCVYITEPVRDAVADTFKTAALGEMQLRGVEKAIPVFSICDLRCSERGTLAVND
ncbi:MAG: adenylate/guanylate cyclase domain-containing protein [Desulfobulbus sp.]|nr:adenylate/guanylate cyclase domain-containing protein [Desulfobulbus sp.]